MSRVAVRSFMTPQGNPRRAEKKKESRMKSDEKTRSMETSEMLAGELLLRVDEMEATVVEHSRRVDQSLSTATAQAAQHLEDAQQRMRALEEQATGRMAALEERLEESLRKRVVQLEAQNEQLQRRVEQMAERMEQMQQVMMPKQSGLSCADARKAGLNLRQIIVAGYGPWELMCGGFARAETVQAGGYTEQQLVVALEEARKAGYSCKEANAAGYSCEEAKAAGYTCGEVKAAGYVEGLKAAGYSCAEAKEAGYTCGEARAAGYAPYECCKVGFSYEEGRAAGYSYIEKCWYRGNYAKW